jgi:acetyl-CoA C-acetyltransferase
VARAGIAPEEVDWVVMGHVLQAGAGQITARQGRGRRRHPTRGPGPHAQQRLPVEPDRSRLADQMIRAGELETAVAGGMESMSNAPYVLPKVRWEPDGRRRRRRRDDHDGLWSTFTGQHMGESSDEVNAASGSRARIRTLGGALAPARRGCRRIGAVRARARRGRRRRGRAVDAGSIEDEGDPAPTRRQSLAAAAAGVHGRTARSRRQRLAAVRTERPPSS